MAPPVTGDKDVRCKLSDDKLGHLSTRAKNNISDFITVIFFNCVKMLVFQSKKREFARSIALLI